MSFKVNRIESEKESYKTTVNWLNDFSKSANFQDRVKERRDAPQVEKFSTIEDKMMDIKARVGFSNLKNATASNRCGHLSKYASNGCGCETEGCSCEITKPEICDVCKKEDCTCQDIVKTDVGCQVCKKEKAISSDYKLEQIRSKIESLLVYVEELIKDRGYSTVAEVYGHCKSDPELYFSDISKNIDHKKFEQYANDLIQKYYKPSGDYAKYISMEDMAEDSLSGEDMTPSYFRAHSS